MRDSRPDLSLDEAQAIALEHRIDLPSACSVLLGVLPLEVALQRRAGPGTRAPGPSDTAANEEPDRTDSPAAPAGARRSNSKVALVLLLCALVVALVGLKASHDWDRLVEESRSVVAVAGEVEPPPVPDSAERGTPVSEIRQSKGSVTTRAADGQLVELSGSSPVAVLREFCRANFTGYCEPLEIATTRPAGVDSRLGIFQRSEGRYVVRIRRNRKTGRWVAGDGTRPVPVSAMHDDWIGDVRHPIPAQLRSAATPEARR